MLETGESNYIKEEELPSLDPSLLARAMQAGTKRGAGCILKRMKKCGKGRCKCNNGKLHGPYFYLQVMEQGKRKQYYLGKRDPRMQVPQEDKDLASNYALPSQTMVESYQQKQNIQLVSAGKIESLSSEHHARLKAYHTYFSRDPERKKRKRLNHITPVIYQVDQKEKRAMKVKKEFGLSVPELLELEI